MSSTSSNTWNNHAIHKHLKQSCHPQTPETIMPSSNTWNNHVIHILKHLKQSCHPRPQTPETIMSSTSSNTWNNHVIHILKTPETIMPSTNTWNNHAIHKHLKQPCHPQTPETIMPSTNTWNNHAIHIFPAGHTHTALNHTTLPISLGRHGITKRLVKWTTNSSSTGMPTPRSALCASWANLYTASGLLFEWVVGVWLDLGSVCPVDGWVHLVE